MDEIMVEKTQDQNAKRSFQHKPHTSDDFHGAKKHSRMMVLPMAYSR